MLLDPARLDVAIEMHAKSYALLKWVGEAVSSGLLTFNAAHRYTTLPLAAKDWIDKHYLNIPQNARVEHQQLVPFANFFSTYLENSFELVPLPGKIKYSPDGHCFCQMCSWMIDAPNLKTKKLSPRDKKNAVRMQINAVLQLSIDIGQIVEQAGAEAIVNDPLTGEASALLAYGHDLIHRLDAIANGPAVLALWRRFAWTRTGSPKPKFQLSSRMILDAELRLRGLLSE
jgi:hypothetical protein